MKIDDVTSDRGLFLDTTFVLPFFQVPIAPDDFEISGFKALIATLPKIHVAELSVYEAKAKLFRLSRTHDGYDEALQEFGRNLSVLRQDDKFVFHNYTDEDDERFNKLLASTKLLDAFDLTILSQAFTAGELLTEDEDLLSFRNSDQFTKTPLSKSIKITRWKEIAARQTE